jgi:hypothetical protein
MMKTLMTAIAITSTLFCLNSVAANTITKCGNYYVNRASQQVYTVNEYGVQRPLGAFAAKPQVTSVETYPPTMQEKIVLTSGITFTINTNRIGQSAVMSDGTQTWNLGSCNASASSGADASKIGLE